VVVIIGVMATPLLLTYRSHRTSQALLSSAETVANHTRSAHVFAREARTQRGWGVRSTGQTSYSIFSLSTAGTRDEQKYVLDSGVAFEDDFEILFEIGTGDTARDATIVLVNANGRKSVVNVGRSGVVEVIHE